MNIIKPGRLPEEQMVLKTCSNCKCEFEFQLREATLHAAVDQRDTDYYSINCPTCHKAINFAA